MARLNAEPPLLMGILNTTPDSFSDGGLYADPGAAVRHAKAMVQAGADIIDVGAESTRPGHDPIDAATELDRLLPVLRAITAEGLGVPVSVDTYKAESAAAALAAGADIVNDVWGMQRDAEMADVVARASAPVICMHNRRAIDETIDIVADVVAFLQRSLDIAAKAGVAADRIVLDPGFGFGKSFQQSLDLLLNLEAIGAFGRPVLIGLSRKGFIGAYSGVTTPSDRLAGTLTANQLAVMSGHAAIIRVHDVAAHRQMLDFLKAASRQAG